MTVNTVRDARRQLLDIVGTGEIRRFVDLLNQVDLDWDEDDPASTSGMSDMELWQRAASTTRVWDALDDFSDALDELEDATEDASPFVTSDGEKKLDVDTVLGDDDLWKRLRESYDSMAAERKNLDNEEFDFLLDDMSETARLIDRAAV